MQRHSISIFEWFKFISLDLVYWTLAGLLSVVLVYFFYQNITALVAGLVTLKFARILAGHHIQKRAIEKYLNLKAPLRQIAFNRFRKFMPFTFGVSESSAQWKNKGIWGFSGPALIARLDPSLSDLQCTSLDSQIRECIEQSSRANLYQKHLSWMVGAGVIAGCLDFYMYPEHKFILILVIAGMIVPVWIAYESIEALNLMEYLEEVRNLNFY